MLDGYNLFTKQHLCDKGKLKTKTYGENQYKTHGP